MASAEDEEEARIIASTDEEEAGIIASMEDDEEAGIIASAEEEEDEDMVSVPVVAPEQPASTRAEAATAKTGFRKRLFFARETTVDMKRVERNKYRAGRSMPHGKREYQALS